MGIASDLAGIKEVSDTIVANKVSKFAYTDYAYEHNDADGVDTYNVNNEQNIPLGTPSIMKVNETVINKGWRARASSITRMLMNHFLGRLSYNVNKLTDMFSSLLTVIGNNMGVANGFASLDANGRIPYSQLPESAVELKGYWNAETNTPALADGTGTNGDEYYVDVAGTQDLGSGEQNFLVGDRVLYIDGVWKNISGGTVRSVDNTLPDSVGNVNLPKVDNAMANGADKIFSAKGAYDYTFGASSVKEWFGKVFSHLFGTLWKVKYDSYFVANGVSYLAFGGGMYEALSGGEIYYSSDMVSWNRSIHPNSFAYARRMLYANGIWICVGQEMSSTTLYHSIYKSVDGIHWVGVLQTQTNLTFTDVRYANGIWLAIGNQGIWWSEDGDVWTKVDNIGSYTFAGIDYAQGKWIAGTLGNNGLWSSDNGKVWTHVTGAPDYGYRAVIYAGDMWVAGAISQGLWYSDDGETWAREEDNNTNSLTVETLYYANALYIANLYSGGVLWSEDGKNWSFSNITSYHFYSELYDSEIGWLAGCGDSSSVNWIYHSDDGKYWTQIQEYVNADVSSLSSENGVVYATTMKGIYKSDNGVNWQSISTSPYTLNFATDNGSIIVAGAVANKSWVVLPPYPSDESGGLGLWWSEDGEHWYQSYGDSNKTKFYSACYSNGIWVAGSYKNGIWWSEDGKNWTKATGIRSDTYYKKICFGKGVFVACSDADSIVWSEDGKVWTPISSPFGYTNDVIFTGENFIAVGDDYISVSSDGKNWTTVLSGSSAGANGFNLAYGNGIVVKSSTVKYSINNGYNWISADDSFTCSAVYYGNGLFIARKQSGGGLYWSTNGKVWTQCSGNVATITAIAVYFANGLWIATTSTGLYKSIDGISWGKCTNADSTTVGYFKGTWFACSWVSSSNIQLYANADVLLENGVLS